ncbi:hypothetical protein [Acinetobacter stercoris]|uniref:Uncharacterized protein n=1 Tax=Acinetobacter stercoris TaxID=2126983 RepID=A0A2U3N3I3_9GAMM|nr:hypothetical protein [Acinetobacter stercoris]SPL72174.1 hypothetical protein KPC_3352 [Acinetobacter stercoris]
MNYNFFILSKLLSNTRSLLFSGYIAFSLSIICIILKGWQFLELWIYTFLSIILVALHQFVSILVKFDADILDFISKLHLQNINNKQLTEQLDSSLIYFKLMPKNKTGRNWNTRFQGCLKLFKLQIILLVIQYIMLIILIYILLNN